MIAPAASHAAGEDLLDALGGIVVLLDPAGRVLRVNRAFSEATGWDLGSLRDATLETLLAGGGGETERARALVSAIAARGGRARLDAAWRARSQGARWIAAELSMLQRPGGTKAVVLNGVDVTELRREREVVHGQWRQLFDQAPDGIFVADLTGAYTDVNDAGCRLLGYSREEIIGKRITDLIPEGDAPRLWESREEMLDGGAHKADWHLRRRDGSSVAVEVNAKILEDGRWQGFVRDISVRKRQEEALRALLEEVEAERRWLRAVIETVPMAVVLFGRDGSLTFNRRTEELLGAGTLSANGRRVHYAGTLLRIDGTPVAPEELVSARVLEHGETVVAVEFLVARPDGIRIPVLGSAGPIRDSDGHVIGGVGVFQDVTDRMRTEGEIRAKERLLDGIFELLPVGVWLADATGTIVRGNPEAIRIWGGARFVGVSQFDEYKAWRPDTGELVAPHEWALARALENGETTLGEILRIQCFDGTEKTIINSAMPVYDEEGAFAGGVVVNQDITAMRETEEALRHALRARDEVLGIVAHDLRNPLGTLSIQLQLMTSRGGAPERRDQRGIQLMRRQVGRMERLIQDLLDVARIDAGALRIEPAKLDPVRTLEELVESQQRSALEKSIELRLEVPRELPAVWADHGRLLQVLENLVSNARKFTQSGGHITVGAARNDDQVRFFVSDDGEGISPENLPHLFDRFWQGGRGDKRGAGLGLAIVRGIVEAHGGRVWATSELGRGTTLHFTIPIADTAPAHADTARGD